VEQLRHVNFAGQWQRGRLNTAYAATPSINHYDRSFENLVA
jgi:hypothetical protein